MTTREQEEMFRNLQRATEPWTYGPTEDPGVHPDWRHLRLEVRDGVGDIVARLPDGTPECRAALLCAAPLLLAACRELLAAYGWPDSGQVPGEGIGERLRQCDAATQAEAAIRAADGEVTP